MAVRLFVKEYWPMLILLVSVSVLTFFREPLYFLEPRIWAEEGQVYLSNALHSGKVDALFETHLGYFSFFNNSTAMIAATLVPLEYAAHLTTYASLLIQLSTILLIVRTPSMLLPSKEERYLVGIALVILGTPEVWLNTINMHFWMATGTFFLLNSSLMKWPHLLYLALSFSSSVPSLFFAPFFLLRYLKEKEKSFIWAFMMAVTALPLQLFGAFEYFETSQSLRMNPENLDHISFAVAKFVSYAFDISHFGVSKYWRIPIFVIFFCILLYYLCRERKDLFFISVVPLLFYTVLSVILSVSMLGGQRYALPVTVAVFAAVVVLSKRYVRTQWAIIPVALLAINLPDFFDTSEMYDKSWPNWRVQIESWDQVSPTQIMIFPQWPDAKWTMELAPKKE